MLLSSEAFLQYISEQGNKKFRLSIIILNALQCLLLLQNTSSDLELYALS